MIIASYFFNKYLLPNFLLNESNTFIIHTSLKITLFRSLLYLKLLLWSLFLSRSLLNCSTIFLYTEIMHYSKLQGVPFLQLQWKNDHIYIISQNFIISFILFFYITFTPNLYYYILYISLIEILNKFYTVFLEQLYKIKYISNAIEKLLYLLDYYFPESLHQD
jgi:hypothetical protein